MLRITTTLSAGALALVAMGCHFTPRGSTPEMRAQESDAAYRIAAAQCDREQVCRASAASATGANACVPTVASRERENLGDCTDPVDADALDDCLREVRAETCGTDSTAIDACAPRQLCPYEPLPGSVMNESKPPALATK